MNVVLEACTWAGAELPEQHAFTKQLLMAAILQVFVTMLRFCRFGALGPSFYHLSSLFKAVPRRCEELLVQVLTCISMFLRPDRKSVV